MTEAAKKDTSLAKALVKALGELTNPERTGEAKVHTQKGDYSYKYAQLPEILNSVRETFSKHGLAVMQDSFTEDSNVAVSTKIIHESGEFVESRPFALPSGGTAQTAGSADTYARRYSLTSFLGIAGEDDDDGEAVGKVEGKFVERPKEQKPGKINRGQVGLLHVWIDVADVPPEWTVDFLSDIGLEHLTDMNTEQMNRLRDKLIGEEVLAVDGEGNYYNPQQKPLDWKENAENV